MTFTETVVAPPATGCSRADISVTLTAPATVAPNGTVQAVVTVRNNGPFDATSVTAALTMPKALPMIAAPGGIAPRNGHDVAYLISSITASTQVTYTVTLEADARTTGPQALRAAANHAGDRPEPSEQRRSDDDHNQEVALRSAQVSTDRTPMRRGGRCCIRVSGR